MTKQVVYILFLYKVVIFVKLLFTGKNSMIMTLPKIDQFYKLLRIRR